MNEAEKRKLAAAKQRKPEIGLGIFNNDEITEMHSKLNKLYEYFGQLLDQVDTKTQSKENAQALVKLNNNMIKLIKRFEQGVTVENFDAIREDTKAFIQNWPKTFTISNPTKLPDDIAKDTSLQALNANIVTLIEKYRDIIKAPVRFSVGQRPDDFVPFRRVRFTGGRLQFDDGTWNMAGGFGGGSSSSAAAATPEGLVIPEYDYVSAAYPLNTQEVYTFKSGGVGGTTVATVTIDYTDNTKELIATVAKT